MRRKMTTRDGGRGVGKFVGIHDTPQRRRSTSGAAQSLDAFEPAHHSLAQGAKR
jgi:hypothetical protein